MKLIAYVFLMLACIVNWFVVAYRPISQFFTRKGLLRHSLSTATFTSVLRFIPQQTLVQPTSVHSSTQLNALMGMDSVNVLDSFMSFTKLFSSSSDIHRNNRPIQRHFSDQTSLHKYISSTTEEMLKANADAAKTGLSKDGFLVGFMDYDPKIAAISSHKTSQIRRHRSSSTWFSH